MLTSRLGTGLLALALGAAALAPSAQAEPSDPDAPSAGEVRAARERADAAVSDVERVQQLLDRAAAEVEAAYVAAGKAAEAYNGARWRAAEARRDERRAVRRSARADRVLAAEEESYRDVVIRTLGPGVELGALDALITADGVGTLLERSSAGGHVQALLDQRHDDYAAAAAEAADAESAATEAAADADAALDEAAVAKEAAEVAAAEATASADRIERRRERLVRRLARLEGISVELAQERQVALGADRDRDATAQPAQGSGGTPGGDPTSDPTPDPPAGASTGPEPAPDRGNGEPEPDPVVPDEPPVSDGDGAARAVAYARDQLGEPYVWGAAGPRAWDCSGLTSRAWAAGGKQLPHYSVAQYEQATPITAGRLRPGDLVFWSDGGPGEIFHVALYTGGGRIIHAPRTGRPVTEESMYYWRAPDFFARP
ncbi:C40 family peptidase [Nocardioides sp. SYSU DS0651]|uniref:C40 family peptidase n=1 Tax=Nocardioides sp. SYSU DS0651 TaxID=3415955 RepID=UPI003F4BD59F